MPPNDQWDLWSFCKRKSFCKRCGFKAAWQSFGVLYFRYCFPAQKFNFNFKIEFQVILITEIHRYFTTDGEISLLPVKKIVTLFLHFDFGSIYNKKKMYCGLQKDGKKPC